jgi:hypothetical protein
LAARRGYAAAADAHFVWEPTRQGLIADLKEGHYFA